jgi:superfamily I DNA/RNA helicase
VAPNRERLDELRTDITQPEQPGTQGPAIRIMIQHKSKGLTARLFVIAACVAGILPSIELTATIQEQARQREEQRRLFLTRSTGTLVISSAVQIPRGVAMQMACPCWRADMAWRFCRRFRFLRSWGRQRPIQFMEIVTRGSRLLVNRLGRLVWFPLRWGLHFLCFR